MKQSIGNDALKLTASKIVTMVISMISAMLLARFRSLEEYGTYSQLLLVMNLVTTVLIMGLPNSINYFLARAKDESEKKKFLSVYYTLSTLLSIIAGLVLIISVPLIIDYFDNPLLRNFIYVLAIYPWAKIILSSIENILIVSGYTKYLIWFRILNSIALLGIIVIVELFKLNFSFYMLLFIIIEAIFAISVYLIVNNRISKLSFNMDINFIRKILKFSVPVGFASVIGVISIELDKLLIGVFYSTSDLAIYTIAAREMPVTIIASSLTAVLMPQMVRLLEKDKKIETVQLWGSSIEISFHIICFFSIALFTFAPQVISLLYSDKYLPGVSIFRVYCLVLLLRVTYFGIILNSKGKTKFIFYSSIISLMLNLVLSIIFYWIFGFIGPAVASFISIASIQFFQLLATSRELNIPIRKIFPWMKLLYVLIINLIMGYAFYNLYLGLKIDNYVGEIFEAILIGVLWAVCYFCIVFKDIVRKWKILNGSSNLI